MHAKTPDLAANEKAAPAQATDPDLRPRQALIKAGALQSAILNSAYVSIIATDENGTIQIFNVGAERMLGYAAADMVDRITPTHISDPLEVMARGVVLSREFATPIAPGFEAMVFKAARGIEDIYELTSRAISTSALRAAGCRRDRRR